LLFDGRTTFGWDVRGDAGVTDGVLVLGGKRATTARTTTAFSACYVRLEYSVDGTAEPRVDLAVKDIPLYLTPPGRWMSGALNIDLCGEGGGIFRLIGPGDWGGGLSRTQWGERPGRHRSTIGLHAPAGTRLRVRSIKLRPVRDIIVKLVRLGHPSEPEDGLEHLLRGGNLAAWDEVEPGKAGTTWAVTPKHELHVRAGPGELQTKGRWGDFVLQLEARTDADGRGGVLFRGLPDRPGSGYEVPICSRGQDGDGTGSISGLQPARKGVPSDSEWSALTVVAHGNHLAVWVNGYQTADFTDTRPPSEDARKGKGPIRLRGHDLLFRNVRIAELPADAK
jgi:hypothetical protein